MREWLSPWFAGMLPALLLLLFGGGSRSRADDAAPAAGSILEGYHLALGPVVVEGVEDDLSGITYQAATDTLLAIRNKHERVFELDRQGHVLRSFDLAGFEDTEDLVALGDGRVAVIEERRRVLNLCTLPEGSNTLHRPAGGLVVEPEPFGNAGLEGVAYDAAGQRMIVVKEKEPRRIYVVNLAAAPGDPAAVTSPWDLEANGFGLGDVSAVAYLPASGHVLLLSDETRALVECTLAGEEVGRLALTAGHAGLTADVVQPEGVALDRDGNLYVVCEPNRFYVFTKP